MQLLNQIETTQEITGITGTTYGDPIDVSGCQTFAAQVDVDVNTASAAVVPEADVSVVDNTFTLANHGFYTGLKVAASSGGTLPAPLTATDYYAIKVSSSVFKLATTRDLAMAGTAIDLSSDGTGDGTYTPAAIAGASAKLQKSNDGTTWSDEGSATNITADATVWLEKIDPCAKYMRVAFAATAGSMSAVNRIIGKGLA